MRGSIRKRSEKSWSIILDVGTNPETGKRKQQWITVEGTKKKAEAKLTELLGEVNRGEYVDHAKTTFGEWLDAWFAGASERLRPRTRERYRSLIANHLRDGLGSAPLQKLRSPEIEAFYRDRRAAGLSSSSLALLHVVIHSALKSAERKRLIRGNEAGLVESPPRQRQKGAATPIRENVWTPDEARAFLAVAKEAGPQPGVLFGLALELGLRQSEIAALRWEDFDADAAILRVNHQLYRGEFVPLKSGKARPLDLSSALVGALVLHRRSQAELKLRNGGAYRDRGFLFAVDFASGPAKLGDPLSLPNYARGRFLTLIEKAGVKPIKFHGLRHTSATLALATGVPAKVVSERLGHAQTSITLDLYSHVVPALAQDAAKRIGALLHG